MTIRPIKTKLFDVASILCLFYACISVRTWTEPRNAGAATQSSAPYSCNVDPAIPSYKPVKGTCRERLRASSRTPSRYCSTSGSTASRKFIPT